MFLSFLHVLVALALACFSNAQQGGQSLSRTPPASTQVRAAANPSSSSLAGEVACNNSPELCNQNYNNITHLGTHNAAFLRDSSTSFSESGNQFYNATIALSAGVRLLQSQVHDENGTLELCHSSCALFNAGPLTTWLEEIKSWMDSNPNDVVTIILVNSDSNSVREYGRVFASSGLSTYGYTPTTNGPQATWPTLQTLISANTRLITFITDIDYDSTVPYLLPEFEYVFETAFGVTDSNAFSCNIDRPTTIGSASEAIASGYMGMANHFLDQDFVFGIQVPDTDNLDVTNSPSTTAIGALGSQARQCQREWGVRPTFLLVNFFNVGPSVMTADRLNGVTGTGRTVLSTNQLDEDSASGATKDVTHGAIMAATAMVVVALGNFVWL